MDDSYSPKHKGAYPYREHDGIFYEIPKIKDLYEPVMEYMRDAKKAYTHQIRDAIANYFYMSDEARKYRENDKYTVLQMRINVVCYRLARHRLLENVARGLYRISYLGDEALERRYDIDENYLKQIPEIEDDHADNIKLPAPVIRSEYVPVKEVTIKEVHAVRMQDIRFNNMLMMKAVTLENGQIVNAVTGVEEHKLCYETNSGEIKARDVEGYHKGPNDNKWSNPQPFTNNPVNAAYYTGGGSFGDTLTDLMDNQYNISKAELSKRTGILERTIQRMRTGTTKNPNVKDVYAIALVLDIPMNIFQIMLQQLRWDPNPHYPPDSVYMTICAVNRGMKIKDVNEACRQLQVPEIFPISME